MGLCCSFYHELCQCMRTQQLTQTGYCGCYYYPDLCQYMLSTCCIHMYLCAYVPVYVSVNVDIIAVVASTIDSPSEHLYVCTNTHQLISYHLQKAHTLLHISLAAESPDEGELHYALTHCICILFIVTADCFSLSLDGYIH